MCIYRKSMCMAKAQVVILMNLAVIAIVCYAGGQYIMLLDLWLSEVVFDFYVVL